MESFARHQFEMNHRRRVVVGVLAVEQGIVDDRFAQIMLLVTARHTLGNRFVDCTAVEPHPVAEFDETDREPGVLAERHPFRGGDAGVFEVLAEEITAEFAGLLPFHLFQAVEHIGGQVAGGLAAEVRDCRGDGFERDDPARFHGNLTARYSVSEFPASARRCC